MKKMYWFIFNSNGEIISKEYGSEKAAENALANHEYDDGESPDYIDGLELEEN
jgi:hypothetical protein